jgi:phage terminase small subunit
VPLANTVARLKPPPATLGPEGKAFWLETIAEFEIDTGPLLRHLAVCCEALDRMSECRARIKADGLMITDRNGNPMPHPLLKAEASARSAFQSGMRALRLHPGHVER